MTEAMTTETAPTETAPTETAPTEMAPTEIAATEAAATEMATLWARLAEHGAALRHSRIEQLFTADCDRFARYALRHEDMLLDLSKTRLDDRAVSLLIALAEAAGVPERREAMFAGEAINVTEDRAVLHTALRNPGSAQLFVDGVEVRGEVAELLSRMTAFAEDLRAGRERAADDAPFTDVVNIGIGGSDLGPAMATAALAPYHDGPRVHYVSNVDGAHIADTLAGLDPRRTLVVVSSKTFTTAETMTNAHTARAWLVEALGEARVGRHLAAISTAREKTAAFGIAPERTFGYWDWVGGRYSVWTAVGLPLMIAVGAARFRDFLSGAAAMDAHFREAPLAANLPAMLGLVGVWHANIEGYDTRAILPYDQRLARLPSYIQQLDMESNGKSVDLAGHDVPRGSGPIVWGEVGTNGQHAFFQLLHQGTRVVPCEFMVAAEGHEPHLKDHHDLLVANCFAQSQALMRGRGRAEVAARMAAEGTSVAEAERLAPHRAFAGDRPSLTLLYRKLDPYTLGRLIALYEHRVFVEGAVWGLNSFDQWGVELGKDMAKALAPAISEGAEPPAGTDAATAGLLDWCAGLRKGMAT